ncbi:MAG: hypothetical protein C0601_08485 [Candidatus Muiribacterium halophilum]|uniref:phospholipase D n=1 Tax=Muiribacterium halophilum TaxID=2053465 RepID=A0A2N5ZEE3_MUIH1|nr:MAG: hypothetical protein C0601_08485 [Candidatus Muirbacterium halophilum]
MKKIIMFVLLVLFSILSIAGDINAYFAPDGGFAKINKERNITLPNNKKVDATLENGVLKMIMETKDGGKIKICMYALSTGDILDELIKCAGERNIEVKLILDACASWTVSQRKDLIEKVSEASEKYKKEGKSFDFQIKEIHTQSMVDRGRCLTLRSGDKIYGTMHEKFGVFYTPQSKIPYECFAGSSNISYGSDQLYAENRIFFYDSPNVARQFQEEFARLWNEYGSEAFGRCKSEKYVPAYPVAGDVRVVFNSEPITEDKNYRIDEELEKLIRETWWSGGSLDIAMFSFTHRDLADAIIRTAKSRPKSIFRVLLDMTQMGTSEEHISVMGPWLEKQKKENKLENLEIRYKWRANAFAFNNEKKEVEISHTRNLLLHHKFLVVNKQKLAAGSYNWSASAETRNFENIMIFERPYRNHSDIIDRFLAEYDTIWNSSVKPALIKPVINTPQSVDGNYGRKVSRMIIRTLEDKDNQKIRKLIEKAGFIEKDTLKKNCKMSSKKLEKALSELTNATLIVRHRKDNKWGYSLSD